MEDSCAASDPILPLLGVLLSTWWTPLSLLLFTPTLLLRSASYILGRPPPCRENHSSFYHSFAEPLCVQCLCCPFTMTIVKKNKGRKEEEGDVTKRFGCRLLLFPGFRMIVQCPQYIMYTAG